MNGHPLLRLIAWTGGLVGAIAGLDRLGKGDLGGPPLRAGAPALGRWITTRDPASVLMAGVRDVALATAVYLLAVTVLALAAHATRAASLISLSDRVTVPLVRRLVGSVLGVAVAAAPFAGVPSAWATRLPPPPSLTVPAGAPLGPTATVLQDLPPAASPDPPTLRRLPDNDPTAGAPSTTQIAPFAGPPPPPTAAPSTSAVPVTPAPSTAPPTAAPSTTAAPVTAAPSTAPPTTAPSTTAAPVTPTPTTAPPTTALPATASGTTPTSGFPPPTAAVVPAAESPSPPAAVWTVRPGDHLWHIAAVSVQAARQHPVSDAEVAPYWLSVVERNRASLPDPANADLLYVGMTVVLPPLP